MQTMKPRLFMIDNWYAVQTASDTIELFRYDVHEDNGTVEHYAHYCTVTWKDDCIDLSGVDSEGIPLETLRSIFEGRAT